MTVLKINEKNTSRSTPRVLAITGGKGGIGKTSISVNLAIALSRTGSKVCLFDADTGLANINIMLGLHPAYTLEHLFTGERSIQDIVLEGPEGVQIVPGASGFAQCVELDVGQQQRLVSSITALEPHHDYLIVDTAAGISPTVLHFVAACQVAAVVVTPEPTSLTDAFSLLKVLRRRGYRRQVEVIVNMATNSAQATKVYRRFASAVKKYLDLKTDYLGSIWMDESMRSAVSLQRPVALFPQHDPSARSFYRLAEKIDDVFSRQGVPKLAFSAYWQKLVERYSKEGGLSPTPDKPAAIYTHNKELVPVSSTAQLSVNDEQPNRPAAVVDLNGKNYHESLSQVQKQVLEHRKKEAADPVDMPSKVDDQRPAETAQIEEIELTLPESVETDESMQPLSADSENAWIDLRVKLNNFFADENTTPEQITTLLSSCIFSYGERLGSAAIDLVHGLMSTLDQSDINDDHKLLLKAEYARLGLSEPNRKPSPQPVASDIDAEVISVASNVRSHQNSKQEEQAVAYDVDGFGCQDNLAQKIRSAPTKVPLESLLESIKYASLVDSEKNQA
jgi:MinD-like ATPase involved in chromosome partitioning or flagellar assembly